MYLNFFLTSLVEIPGNAFAIYAMNRLANLTNSILKGVLLKTVVDHRNKRNLLIKIGKRVVIETRWAVFPEIVGSNVFGRSACKIYISCKRLHSQLSLNGHLCKRDT